jgi:hypothetical protein
MTRMVRWIEKNIDVESKIIDLGCGNGLMSIELYEVAGHFNLQFSTPNFQPWTFQPWTSNPILLNHLFFYSRLSQLQTFKP